MKTKSPQFLLQRKLRSPSFAKAYEEAGYSVNIGISIAMARQKAGLSQHQLAQKLGTTQSVISRIENGNQNLSLNMLAKIAHLLHCELSMQMTPLKLAA